MVRSGGGGGVRVVGLVCRSGCLVGVAVVAPTKGAKWGDLSTGGRRAGNTVGIGTGMGFKDREAPRGGDVPIHRRGQRVRREEGCDRRGSVYNSFIHLYKVDDSSLVYVSLIHDHPSWP